MRKIILSLSAALLASTPVWAINCQVETDCTTLGYTETKDKGGCLKCPFGNKWACSTSGGVSKDCVVGAILNSDMSCSADVVSGKTPIGVVVSSERQFAIALDQSLRAWSTTYFEIPYIVMEQEQSESNGQYNTYVGYDYCQRYDQTCPAFEYVSEYKTEGTKAGDWYLPSTAELFDIYIERNILNATLTKLGGTPLLLDRYFTSTQFINIDYQNVRRILVRIMDFSGISAPSGAESNVTPGSSIANYVRPVIKFPKPELNPKPTFDACETGAILFSDKTCSDDAVSGKTPIGIVFDGERRRAFALTYKEDLAWSTEYFDIPDLPNYNSLNEAATDWNGKENTKIILDYCKANGKSCPAAEYAASYSTEGTKAGDWYLPAYGEAYHLFRYSSVYKISLSRIRKSFFEFLNFRSTSTENSSDQYWLSESSGLTYKTLDSYNVIPVLAF